MPRFSGVLLVSLLSACATPHSPDEPVTDKSHELWQQRQQHLATLDHWSIRGRVAIFVEDDVHNAGLNWHRKTDSNTLKLEGPFSQGAILLEKNTDGVKLTTADGKQFSGQNPQQLLFQTTGLTIPVDGLQSWIKGVPHTNSDYLPDIDAEGRANNLRQNGWSINYLEYEQVSWSQYNNPELPRKMYLKHNGLALKIVIDQWQDQALPGNPGLFPDFN